MSHSHSHDHDQHPGHRHGQGHGHSHGHGHGHGHAHGADVSGKRFAVGIGLNSIYVAFEIVFGLSAGSLALVADAAHNASDVLSLAAAWAAAAMASKPPFERFTYGLKRSPILASLFNAALLALAIGVIAWQALQRLIDPAPVPGVTVMWVAAIGLVVNTATAIMLMKGSKEDLNVRGAFLHMVADAGVTLGVIIAGGLILLTGWSWIDPLLSLLIVAAILWGTWGLARDAIRLSLDAVPAGTDLQAIREYLEEMNGVNEVHDLHVWPMSTTETALTAHLVIPTGVENPDALLQQAAQGLHDHHAIEHATIQIEHGDQTSPCALAPAQVV